MFATESWTERGKRQGELVSRLALAQLNRRIATPSDAVASSRGQGPGCRFHNPAAARDQRFQAAGSYWLMRPPRIVWVPETLRTSCDLLIFVEEAAEAVVSLDLVDLGRRAVGEWA